MLNFLNRCCRRSHAIMPAVVASSATDSKATLTTSKLVNEVSQDSIPRAGKCSRCAKLTWSFVVVPLAIGYGAYSLVNYIYKMPAVKDNLDLQYAHITNLTNIVSHAISQTFNHTKGL